MKVKRAEGKTEKKILTLFTYSKLNNYKSVMTVTIFIRIISIH